MMYTLELVYVYSDGYVHAIAYSYSCEDFTRTSSQELIMVDLTTSLLFPGINPL